MTIRRTITSNVRYGAPSRLPNQERPPLRKAMNAMNATMFAVMLSTRNTEFTAPCAAASSTFDSVLSRGERNKLR